LSTNRQDLSSFSKLFMMQLVNAIVQLNYAYADIVSPVCKYNTRWELRQGVENSKIKVIYNGVDPTIFKTRQPVKRTPTVVTIARIDPLKDIETLIRTAAVVKKKLPDSRFIVYGPATSTDYYETCINLREDLGLENTVIFAGQTDDAPSAYHSGDIVLLTSISEAFPYTVIEAMMSGKAVVASNVGGTSEALEGCGLLVPPREPQLMAQEILKLFDQPKLRVEMEQDSRERALTWFSINQAVSNYLSTYEQMTRFTVVSAERRLQLVNTKRGLALLNIGQRDIAVNHLRQAVINDPLSPAVPVILTYIASAYFMDGKYAEAHMELKKADLIHELIAQRTA
jgi:polysaccharide biosynthesis protein PelF